MGAESVSSRIYEKPSWQDRLALVIKHFKKNDQHREVARITAPIHAAERSTPRTMSRGMAVQWTIAAIDALAAGTAYLAHTSPATTHQWLRTLEVCWSLTLDLLTALRHSL